MIITVLFYVFVAFTAIQIIYYIFFSSFLFKQKKDKKTIIEHPISVLIFAKNQSENLQKFLPSILEQEYSKFEILLINNASIDNTDEVLEELKNKYSNIKIIDVENNEAFWGSKKYALTLGIKAAKYHHLLFTDASSKPVSKKWMQEINSNFSDEKTIILGYSKVKKENTFSNLLVRFENLMTALKAFSFLKYGSAYKAFSNNFAYHRKEFYNAKGFINHMKISDGETDLFLKDVSKKQNTSFCISEDSFIETQQTKPFSNWYHQKKRDVFIKKKYLFKHRFFLNLFAFSKLIFYILATTLFFFYPYKIILPIVLFYFLVQFIVIGLLAKKLKEPILIYFLPFLEIGLLLIQISIFSAHLISKPNHWK